MNRYILSLIACSLLPYYINTTPNTPAQSSLKTDMYQLSDDEVRELFMIKDATDWNSRSSSNNNKKVNDIVNNIVHLLMITNVPKAYTVLRMTVTNTGTQPTTLSRSSYLKLYRHALTSSRTVTQGYPNFNQEKWVLRIASVLLPILGITSGGCIFKALKHTEGRFIGVAVGILLSLASILTIKESQTAEKLEKQLDELHALSPVLTTQDATEKKLLTTAEHVVIPAGATLTDFLILDNHKITNQHNWQKPDFN